MMNGEIVPQTNIPDKRAAILETTLKLLSERGFHNTPMSMIVRESGVSTGIVYHYFANKNELITELYREIKIKGFRTLLSGHDEDASYQDQFLYLWKSIVQTFIDHPKETKFLEQYEHSPYYDANWAARHADLIEPLVVLFQNGIDEGMLKNLPWEILMELGTATAVALAKQHISGVFQLSDEMIDSAANACWDMIKK